jgi:hypothetical protein
VGIYRVKGARNVILKIEVKVGDDGLSLRNSPAGAIVSADSYPVSNVASAF